LAKLRAAGFSGYRIKKVKTRFEVAREFATKVQALAEVSRLARAGFHAHVQLAI
jgi:hypothetical protein